ITTMMTVDSVLRTWPEAEPIFAEYKIPTRDQTVPSWEPILQTAVAQGLTHAQQEKLLVALNDILY
ncbi:MAG: hypothetical protein AAF614_31900, partial [Chloroflexota bacterium]